MSWDRVHCPGCGTTYMPEFVAEVWNYLKHHSDKYEDPPSWRCPACGHYLPFHTEAESS